MEILVYGAGAVGGYLGARLSAKGHVVTLIVRAVTADLINKQGLFVTEAEHTERTTPTAVTSVAQAFMNGHSYDLIITGMKSYDLADALDPLVAFCSQPPTIITTQNGIGVEEILIEQFGTEPVIAGSFTIPVRKESGNKLIAERSDCGFALAPTCKGQDIRQWARLFQEAGISTIRVDDYESMVWSKVLLNIVGNATSAILNRQPKIIYQSNAMFDLEYEMLQEALAVVKARKLKIVNFPGVPARRLARAVRLLPSFLLKSLLTRLVDDGRGDKMPSFHIDLASGRQKSEVTFYNGAIAEAGEELGIPMPINGVLTDILMKLTYQELDWQEFDGNPKRLLAEIRKY